MSEIEGKNSKRMKTEYNRAESNDAIFIAERNDSNNSTYQKVEVLSSEENMKSNDFSGEEKMPGESSKFVAYEKRLSNIKFNELLFKIQKDKKEVSSEILSKICILYHIQIPEFEIVKQNDVYYCNGFFYDKKYFSGYFYDKVQSRECVTNKILKYLKENIDEIKKKEIDLRNKTLMDIFSE